MKEKREEIIQEYLQQMREKYGIIGAMVTGSYVTGQMGPNSDIDIFMIWPEPYQSLRGREFYQGVEFEYFISPEWKFYDRLRNDPVTMRIYASCQVLTDFEGRLAQIIETAQQKVAEYGPEIGEGLARDYAFWLETIQHDGEDLIAKGELGNFHYFTGDQLPRMTNLLCKIKKQMPVYSKYGVKEVKEVDVQYGQLLEDFLLTHSAPEAKKEDWVQLCTYLQQLLGNPDIRHYESRQKL